MERQALVPAWLLFPVGLAALVVALGALGYGILWALHDKSAVFAEAWRILVTLPPSTAKTMDILAVLLVLSASILTPLALIETRASRAFARYEETLRRERPEDVVVPYEGAEGTGLAFDGPSGRLLLLHPEAGVGDPRVVLPEGRPPSPSYPSPDGP